MFKQLYNILKNDNLLEQSFERAADAMTILETMFAKSVSALRDNMPDPSYDIFLIDKQINEHERAIRRKSLTHLTVTGQDDLNPTLVLITIVHDIERIGDYNKNIFELSSKFNEKLQFFENEKSVKEIERILSATFAQFNKDFLETSKESSRKFMDQLLESRNLCDQVIDSILLNINAEPSQHQHRVIGVLYVRFLKRIAAHLNNIATSFVNPFDRIGSDE
jgi:phosphate uptake regulator